VQLRLLMRSAIVFTIFLVIYFLVVVVTTPNFPPLMAVYIAINLNGIYIFGSAISLAVQTWIMSYSKTIPYCEIPKGKASSGLNIFGSIASAFFSFLALIGVGCCGTWLLILSVLPGVIGVGAASILIRYSTLFAQIGLGLMIVSNIYAFVILRRKLKIYRSKIPKEKQK